MRIHLDFETRSRAKIGDTGTVRYLEDESTMPVIMAIAADDDDPVLWSHESLRHCSPHDPKSDELLDYLKRGLKKEDTVHAFNYLFEHFALLYHFGIEVPARNWRCTQILGRIAGYPENLQDLCDQLSFDDGKIEAGKSLLNYFCSPITSGKRKGEFHTIKDDVWKWWELTEYCLQDVVVERECYHILKRYWPVGDARKAFLITHAMNVRGIPINKKVLDHAQSQLDEALDFHVERFVNHVGYKPTQTDQCKQWFQARGYPFESLDKEHVAAAMSMPDVMDEETRYWLKEGRSLTPAAVKKLKKFSTMLCKDNTIKGVMTFYGAQQTGRWSSKDAQVQNVKRPNKQAIEFFEELLKGATWDVLEKKYGSFVENLSFSIRGFIGVWPGFANADFSSIEARITAWYAQQEDLVEAFATGRKVYEMMAAFVFDMKEEDVAEDSLERHIGKSLVLGAGFGLGEDGFARNAGCEPDIAAKAIQGYREKNYKIVELWRRLTSAAFAAMRNPGKTYNANPHGPPLKFWYGPLHTRKSGTPEKYLVVALPSGRRIYYLRPRIAPKKVPWGDEMRDTIFYLSRDPKTGRMILRSTWHGTFIENIVQATAADLMMNGAIHAWKDGFDIRMLIHDEANAQRDPSRMEYNAKRLIEKLTILPDWAEGLPLAASGKNVPYYTK